MILNYYIISQPIILFDVIIRFIFGTFAKDKNILKKRNVNCISMCENSKIDINNLLESSRISDIYFKDILELII